METKEPSSKQLMYLQSLCGELGYQMKAKETPVTKKEASEMISRLLEAQNQIESTRDDIYKFK